MAEIFSFDEAYKKLGYTQNNTPGVEVGVDLSVQSGLTLDQTNDWLNKNEQWEQDWKPVKAIYNGVVGMAQSVIGTMRALRHANIAQLNAENPNRQQASDEYLNPDNWAKASWLTPYKVKGDNVVTQFGLDVLQNAPQLIAQIGVTAATGGLGGMAFMATQIGGAQYNELVDSGVAPERALIAAATNAAAQSVLEQIGVDKIMKGLPLKSTMRQKLATVLGTMATEGTTEALQELPEQLTEIWAKHPELDAQQIGAEWDKNAAEYIKNALYAGAIGAVFGGAGGGVNVAINNYVEKATESIMKAQVEHLTDVCENDVKSGINPEYIATTADTISELVGKDSTVFIEAEPLQGFFQTIEDAQQKADVARLLGYNEDDIVVMAEKGGEIPTSAGALRAANARSGGALIEAVKNNIALDAEQISLSAMELRKELRKAYNGLSDVQKVDLDNEVIAITDSAIEAGATKKVANSLRPLFVSRAMVANPDNPAQFYKDHPLRFQKGDFAEDGKFNQSAWHGSPHNFEKFDLGAIGTGEGAQAHGWGLYFAQDKKVAERYRETLSDKRAKIKIAGNDYMVSGNLTYDKDGKHIGKYDVIAEGVTEALKHNEDDVKGYVLGYLEHQKEDRQEEVERAIEEGDKWEVDFWKKSIKNIEEQINLMNDFSVEIYDGGALYETDVPDVDVLLDEQESLEEQPEKVKKAILEYWRSRPDNYIAPENIDGVKGTSGKAFYNDVVLQMKREGATNPRRAVSELLNKYGVKGITYEGGSDGRCYVVFDDKAINIINKFNQEANQKILGQYSPQREAASIITLFDGADASTIIHESGHYFFDAMEQEIASGNTDERLLADFNTLLKYGGVSDFATWSNMSLNEKRTAHEKVAEAFESYIMKGEAPSMELRSVFRRFMKWLSAIYSERKRSENAIPLTDEVAQVFDRWFACDAQITAIEQADGILAKLPKVVLDKLSDKGKAKLQDLALQVHDKAVAILVKKSMANFSEERQKAIAEYQEQIRAGVINEVDNMPVYLAQKQLLEYTDVGIGSKATTNARAIARRYLDEEGRTYTDWQEELDAVNSEINDMTADILSEMEGGIRGVEIVAVPQEMGGGNDYMRVSMNDPWYRHFWEDYGRKPSKQEMFELAVEMVKGTADPRYMTQGMYMLQIERDSNPKLDAWYNSQEQRIDELLARREELQAKKDAVAVGRRKGLSVTDRTSFEVAAETNGFANGQELAYQILNMPTHAGMVKQKIAEYTRLKYPDFWSDKQQAEQEAREALYNQNSEELIALEEQLMYDAMNDIAIRESAHADRMAIAKARVQNAKLEAQEIMAGMSIRESNRTQRFIAAERRAAANAARAAAKGDAEAAMKYKRQQLVAHEMVRISAERKALFQKNVTYLRHLARQHKKEYWGNEQHLQAAGQLLGRMGLKVKGYDPDAIVNKQSLNEYIAEMTDKYGNMVDVNMEVVDGDFDLSNPLNLSWDEFNACVDAAKNIKAIARMDTQLFRDEIARQKEETKGVILTTLSKLETVFTPEVGERTRANLRKKFVASLRNSDNLFEKMDNWTNGYFSKHWATMLKHCADKEAKMVMELEDRLVAIDNTWKEALKAQGIDVNDQVAYADLGTDANGNPVTLSRYNLIMLLCNLANESSMKRLCTTKLVGIENTDIWVEPEAVNDPTGLMSKSAIRQATALARKQAAMATRQNLIEFLSNHITDADVNYAQSLINACGQYWPELAQLNVRTKGFSVAPVEAMPVELTIGGRSVVLDGGYFPLVRNGEMGSHPFGQSPISETDEYQGRNIGTFQTNSGSSMARTNANYPVNISQGAFMRTIRDTIHDICYREAMSDFRWMFNDPDIFAMLKTKLGIETTQQFREMCEKTANPYSNGPADMAEQTLADACNWLRRKIVNAAIMLNFKTGLQNLSNLFLFGNAVEGFGYSDVMRAMFGNYGMRAFRPGGLAELDAVCSKSVFMQERAKGSDFSIREVLEQDADKLNDFEKKILKWGAQFLLATDNLTAKPVWAEAYAKKINAGATEQEAIDFADAIIRRTLGSNRIQDISSLQRGGPLFRLFTTFQGFFNTQCNQWMRNWNIANNMWNEGQRFQAAMRISSFAAAKYFFTCLAASALAIQNPFEEDDDGWTNLEKELIFYPLSLGGPVGQTANMLVSNLLGIRSYGYRMLPVQSSIDRLGKAARTGFRWWDDRADLSELVESSVGVVAPAVGVPDQLNKVFWNTYDILYNDMEPEWGDLVRRRPKSER